MSTNFIAKKNIRRYLGFINEVENGIKITMIDTISEVFVCDSVYLKENLKITFEKESHFLHRRLKAVFVLLPKCSYEFCTEVKAMLNSYKIPNHFLTDIQLYLPSMLIPGGYISKLNERILFITAFDENYVTIYGCKFTKNGYIQSSVFHVTFDENKNDEIIRAEILQNFNPNALFIHANPVNMIRLKQIFKASKNVFTFENEKNDWNPALPKYIIEYSKWFFDKTYIKFYFQPISETNVLLFSTAGDITNQFFAINISDQLPISHTVVVKKIVTTCSISLQKSDEENAAILATWLPDQDAHQHQISLSMDEEGFIKYEIKPILWPQVEILRKLLAKNLESRIPIIVFVENLSFVYVYDNEEDEYELLNSWNGKFGMDLYISFDEKNPKYCQNALEVARIKPTFVVSNIFQIMTMSPEDAQQIKNEQFEITKDDENEVLLEFDNFDGTKMAASPQFLMALLLKQHFKAIKNECEEKATEIGFLTFADLSKKEIKRAKNQLNEACEMLKISCQFLDYNKLKQN